MARESTDSGSPAGGDRDALASGGCWLQVALVLHHYQTAGHMIDGLYGGQTLQMFGQLRVVILQYLCRG